MRDFNVPALAIGQPFASITPGLLGMCEIAQPLRSLVAVVLQNRIYRFPSVLVQLVSITPGNRPDQKCPTMCLIQVGAYGAISPRFDAFLEKGTIIPHQRPCL